MFSATPQNARAALRTSRPGNIGKDSNPNGIGKGVQNSFDRDVFNRRMKKRPHQQSSSYWSSANSSIVLKFGTNESLIVCPSSHPEVLEIDAKSRGPEFR